MSKPVRIREFVALPVAAAAEAESRSFANMVEVLLLAALAERDGVAQRWSNGAAEEVAGSSPVAARSVSADVAANIPGVTVGIRAHMRGDRPNLECKERVPVGQVCAACGRTV